jgi:hypothetical protein
MGGSVDLGNVKGRKNEMIPSLYLHTLLCKIQGFYFWPDISGCHKVLRDPSGAFSSRPGFRFDMFRDPFTVLYIWPFVHKYLHWFAQNRNYVTGTYRVIIDDFRSPVCCSVGQYRANAAFVLTGTVRISGYLCCTRGSESRPRRPRPASRISAPWCQVCDGGTERRTPEPKKFHPNLKPEPEITIIYNARAHLADRPIWMYVIKHRQFSNRRLCGVVACTRPILSGCAVLGFWSLSGAVEDRQ